jgi:hypothetical protein
MVNWLVFVFWGAYIPLEYWAIQPILAIGCLFFSAGAIYVHGVTNKYSGVIVAAAVLGTIGGIIIALSAPFYYAFIQPPLPAPPPPPLPGEQPLLGQPWAPGELQLLLRQFLLKAVGGTLAFLVILVGAVLTLGKPKVGGILMLLGTIVGWITYPAWSASLFLFPAIVLTLVPERKQLPAIKERPAAIYPAMAFAMFGGLFAIICSLFMAPAMMRPLVPLPQEIELLVYWSWALLFPGIGLLGGILLLIKPKVAGILTLISGGIIGPPGFIYYDLLREYYSIPICVLASYPLIIAGIIALVERKRPIAIYIATALAMYGGAIATVCTYAVLRALWQAPDVLQGIERLAVLTWADLFPGMALLGGIVLLIKPKVGGILTIINGSIIGPLAFIYFELFEFLPMCANASIPQIIAGAIGCIKKQRG